MVQLQQRLEVTLQELANLERFTKKQQQTANAPPNVEQLLKEESYLKARLLYVQQVRRSVASPRLKLSASLSYKLSPAWLSSFCVVHLGTGACGCAWGGAARKARNRR